MKAEEQDFTAEFTLEARPPAGADGDAAPQECAAIVLWFDTAFSQRHCREAPVVLSTSVYAPPTHWVQTVLLLKEPVVLAVPGGQVGRWGGRRTDWGGQGHWGSAWGPGCPGAAIIDQGEL